MFEDTVHEDEGRGFMGSAFFMLAAGAAIGAAAALMFAPASGRQTRAYLGERGRHLADDVAERGRHVWAEHGQRVTSALRRGYEQATSAMGEEQQVPPRSHQVS